MDDHNFIIWEQGEEPNYDDMIENDEMDELNDMIEEQVEGYEEVNMLDEASETDEAYYIDEEMIPEPQENLIYLADDQVVNGSNSIGVGRSHLIEQRVQEAENKIIGDQDVEEEYTVQEVITEDWPLEGEDMVQVAMEQVVTSENFQEDDIETVPLHTDQDEYTTSRPYPCDFCSRRFRKKANLMNHMVAHQNVRPHMCNLCGSRYVRKCDLINHLKIHAYNIEDESSMGGPSTGGKKKPPKYDDELDFRNDIYDDIPEDDDFDYNHYTKPTTSTAPVRKTVVKKKPVKKQAIKFEKLTKDKMIPKEMNITFHDHHEDESLMAPYVERFPITDPRKPFVCQHCGVAFTREKALESHTKLHVNQEPTFDCEVCGDSFYDSTSLEEHLELRHDFSSRIRRTGGKSTSGKVAPRAKVLETMDYDDSNSEYEPDKNNEDLDDDDEEEDSGHTCDKCHMSFKNPEALKRHIKSHFIKPEILSDDDGERPEAAEGTSLGCNVCGESFTEALDLLAHAEIHARFQPFKCQLCGETFFEENKIKIHLLDNHQKELTESSCRLCGKQCRDQRSLIKHSWEHSREKNHPCSKCGKTFHNKARLKRHISSHRNKSVMCEICHEEFPDGRQLMNHRHSHTKANQFPCHECGKTFGSRSSQQIHIRIHTGERPYGCRFCWKAFADGGTLRKHERIHTGEKPYCCLVCPRAFNQRVVLREHIRSHHSAADPVHGTTLTPFYCSLCGDLFAVALDLIHHLIEHSDRSTAAKRVQPTGPRKYKRRRKLNGDSDNSDFVTVETNQQRAQKIIKQEPIDADLKKNILYPAFPITNEIADFKLPDEIFQSIGKRVPVVKIEEEKKPAKASGSRSKMIYTQKTRVPVADGKRKSRTMIQKQVVKSKAKTTPARLNRQHQQAPLRNPFDNIDESDETWSNDDPNEDTLNTLLKRERKLSEKYTIDLVNDLQDILRSPLKNNEDKSFSNGEDDLESSATRRSRRQVSRVLTLQQKKKVLKTETEDRAPTFIKQEVMEKLFCGICGDSFDTRAKLLDHVPIHI